MTKVVKAQIIVEKMGGAMFLAISGPCELMQVLSIVLNLSLFRWILCTFFLRRTDELEVKKKLLERIVI